MVTTLADLAVEIFIEIFTYLQHHEISHLFSNLNSRFTAIMNNHLSSFIPIYLGLNGMSIEVTKFYYKYLSQSNIASRLISLCVSDTLAIDNGLWLAEHALSTFINLRQLSLIDIKRSSFELILNSLPPMNSLIRFSISFTTDERALDTFIGVPEGAYYERIFHLFPSLRVCHLLFQRKTHTTLDNEFILPPNKTFIPLPISFLNLRSLTIYCSFGFLSHLFEHLPQLEQLYFARTDCWVPYNHPLRQSDYNRITPINKRLAPNLNRLTIIWTISTMKFKSINELFERDVLFSLIKFRLEAEVTNIRVLHHIQSMLSSQCLFSFDIRWFVRAVVPVSEEDKLSFDIFEQLKGPIPVELTLAFEENEYSITAFTVPQMHKYLCVYSYLKENILHEQTPWSYDSRTFNNQWIQCKKIYMSEDYDEMNEEFLSFSPSIVPWHQVTFLSIGEPFNRYHLHFLFSQLTNLRTLELHYRLEFDSKLGLKEETLIDLLDDDDLCHMLMSIGLRQLNIFSVWQQSDLLDIAYSIVERLPDLQVIELHGSICEVIEVAHILINGLQKLNVLTLTSTDGFKCGKIYEEKLRALQNSNTRSFQTDVPKTSDENILFVWL